MERIWNNENFEEMSWHDCAVHGFFIVEKEHGFGELTFHIDYILEWLTSDSGNYEFSIVPAELVFHSVSSLKINIDYESVSSAIQPFTIGAIERKYENYHGHEILKWRIEINWPSGAFEFNSEGFTQITVGKSIISSAQFLSKQEREQLIA